jgi:hypothetical protein
MQKPPFPCAGRRARPGLATRTLTILGAVALATVASASSFLTPEASQVTGLDGWTPMPLFTVGETIDGYTPPGILDGLGAQKIDKNTVRVYANHELGNNAGYAYSLANGLQLTGARVSFFDIDRHTRKICDAGPAYDTVYDRYGALVVAAGQINEVGDPLRGFNRFCSSAFYDRNTYGFEDDLYLTGEETTNGSQWALDVRNGAFWACPELGRGAWENVSAVDTGCKDTIGLLMGDDEAAAPLYLWIGRKQKHGGFLERNGLAKGQLYAWVADNGDWNPQHFNLPGTSRAGHFEPVDARDPAMAGMPGYDAQGYLDDVTLRNAALAMGAFSFSRPEDIHTNPRCGTQAAFASTGRGSLYPADDWGTVYLIDVDFRRCKRCKKRDLPESVPATLEIVHSGDALPVPDAGIRSPDNLVWAHDGFVYVQEDKSTQIGVFGGATGREASMWQLDPDTGAFTRVVEVDRSAVVPAGQGVTDPVPGDIGNWETSGVIDVTRLFPRAKGERLLILDVQAHSLTNGVIGGSSKLVQGGQLLLLSKKDRDGRDDDRCERDDDDEDVKKDGKKKDRD